MAARPNWRDVCRLQLHLRSGEAVRKRYAGRDRPQKIPPHFLLYPALGAELSLSIRGSYEELAYDQ